MHAGLACGILIDFDICLGIAIGKEQSESAISFLNLHIHCLVSLVACSKILSVHLASEVECLSKITLIESILVGNTDFRL